MSSLLFISFTNDPNWGENEKLWAKTAIHAAKKDHDVSCAIYNWPENRSNLNALESAGSKLINLPNQGRLKRNFIERLQYKISKRSLKKFIENLSANNYDTVIINLSHFEILSEEIKEWYQSLNNYVLVFHNYTESDYIKPLEVNILRNWVTNSSQNLFISEKSKRYLEDKLNMVILNGETFTNPMSFPIPTFETPAYKGSQYVWSMVAPLNIDLYAQDQLVRAIACPKWMQRNFILNLYGTGKDADRLENLIARKGLTKKVFIKDELFDEKKVIETSNLIFYTTHFAGMPKVIFDSMALSRPLIVTKTGDLNKYVINNNNGWIINNATCDEIDLALELAWNQRNRWEEMGKRSLALLKKYYPASAEEKFLKQVLQKEVKSMVINNAIAI